MFHWGMRLEHHITFHSMLPEPNKHTVVLMDMEGYINGMYKSSAEKRDWEIDHMKW